MPYVSLHYCSGSLCPEKRSNEHGGSASWSVVRWSFRFITVVIRVSRGSSWTSEVFVFVRRGFASSADDEPEAVRLGRDLGQREG